jgi:hypothetical protein
MADLLGMVESKLRTKGTPGTAGIWLDEHTLVQAAAKTRAAGFTKFEAISPYPLHGIDDVMEIPRSFIPWVTFTFGLGGCLFGLWFTYWTHSVDWPIIVGGKPFFSLPAYIPIIFECTILLASLSSVAAMIITNGLPKIDPPIIDPALTSHKFALFVPKTDPKYDAKKVEDLFRSLGADEVKASEF